ncbi:MAG: hypothetical protein NC413_09195 [Muribaculum sp.]|nr:hypothetical protein [Muribaculum sp.]
MDVKRGKYQAEKNLINYALYMTFFPKVTSGPIIRGDEFLPYLKDYQGISSDNFQHGIQMFMLGFFKKVVLADHLGVFVAEIFAAPAAFHSVTVALGVFSYSLQIYFDFAGYSDMAIGISKILGFDFAPNFNLPLVSQSVSEYWRRWHISLGAWFRDYLYYPLSIGPAVKIRKKLLDMGVGRKQAGSIASAIALLIVWMATGLWHGAQMTFVLWGVIQFIFVFYDQNHKVSQKPSRTREFLNWFFTFLVIMLSKVIFRADSMAVALDVYQSMFLWHDGIVHLYSWTFVAAVLLAVGTLAAYIRSKRLGEREVNAFYPLLDLHRVIPLTVFFIFCGLTLILGYFGDTAFIYENF